MAGIWTIFLLSYRQQPSPLLYNINIWPARNMQHQANRAWNESLHSSLRNRVSLVLPCWTLARTTIIKSISIIYFQIRNMRPYIYGAEIHGHYWINFNYFNCFFSDWEDESVTNAEILRLIYQGRFLHCNVTLSALGLATGKTTVMHLVPRENLPEPNSQGTGLITFAKLSNLNMPLHLLTTFVD